MSVIIVVGAQWGDEGKGKIIDYLSQNADMIVRHQGGNNAGHTVYTGRESFVLHLIPSGIIHPQTQCLIGHGVVIDPAVLWDEIATLQQKGVQVTPSRLFISGSAHVIMPYHRVLDGVQEDSLKDHSIGTTRRGIGPAYTDKVARQGIRVWDLIEPEVLSQKLRDLLPQKNALLQHVYGKPPLDGDEILTQYSQLGANLKPFVVNTVPLLKEFLGSGKKVMFEGAQGTLLDVDFGTYPFVTSSNTIAGGACTGAGLGPLKVNEVVGVAKAYCTRVGAGPFPTELPEEEARKIRDAGPVGEYGATTGRPRRCGWLDLPLLRYAVAVNGLTALAITRLDVLSHVDTIQVAHSYTFQGRTEHYPPGNLERLGQCQPHYYSLSGWRVDISAARSWEDLPLAAQEYIRLIETQLGIPVALVSVGPERAQTIVLRKL